MRQYDPHRLSVAATELFLTLAGPQDAVSLVAFSDRAVPLVPLTSLTTPDTKAQLRSRLATLRFTGQTTDLAAALAAGLTSLPPRPGETSRDVVLLLTDGHLDLGAARRAKEPEALAQIRHTLLPQYQQRGIVLYTIAFSPGADQPLLQEMARAAGGTFHYIESAARLHEAFRDLFILARQAEAIPVHGNTFLLDNSIQEATLVVTKQDAREQVRLVTPTQQPVSATNVPPGTTWTSTPAYDLVQLTAPQPGLWQIESPKREGSSVGIIGASTLQLHVTLHPAYREAGETVDIQAMLAEQGEALRTPERFEALTAQAEILTPRGERHALPLTRQADGKFTATSLPLSEPGQYGVTVTVTGPQLQRQRHLSLVVHPPCFQPVVQSGPPATVHVTLATACPAFDALTLEAGHAIDAQPPVWLPLVAARPGEFAVTLPPLTPGQTSTVTLRIQGRLAGADSFSVLKGPWPLSAVTPAPAATPPAATPPPPEVPWQGIARFMLVKLLLINGVLALVGGGGYGLYYYLKRRTTPHV
jgi:hypothetical protein